MTNAIIAFPSNGSGSDIIASAEDGMGGVIDIDAEAVLGIQEREQNPFTNDIDASSRVEGLDGSVTIDTLNTDPFHGATQLSNEVVEPEQTIVQACNANREIAAQNSFTIKGKGGVPPAPELPLNSANIIIDGEASTNSTSSIPQPIATSIGKIQPARGISVTAEGITLTPYRTNNSGDRLPEAKINCRV